jgi:hypothetical protein
VAEKGTSSAITGVVSCCGLSADERAVVDYDRRVILKRWADEGQSVSCATGRLRDPAGSVIVVERRDRVARFGAGYVEAALPAQGRGLLAAGPSEVDGDLVRDVSEIPTSLCAWLHGQRAARNRAERAITALGRDGPG